LTIGKREKPTRHIRLIFLIVVLLKRRIETLFPREESNIRVKIRASSS
jgi:hypothetical protein